jgi:outer membrane lipoprotein
MVAALTGCASSPVSKALKEQAKPVTLAQAAANPSAYTGTVVIWGGQIIQTLNDSNGGAIYVLALPLDHCDSPQSPAVSNGRFIARSQEFIDPEVFRKGRLITVAGEILGAETKPLQKVQYIYPVMAARELHLWVTPPPYYYYPGWGYYGPGWGWYGPGWGWYGPDWGWY